MWISTIISCHEAGAVLTFSAFDTKHWRGERASAPCLRSLGLELSEPGKDKVGNAPAFLSMVRRCLPQNAASRFLVQQLLFSSTEIDNK